ncbi:hypothetical protein CS063_15445 [Sporanaerobium hydrogeniformans]|uniref:Uncharacterized protein n=1 Tax=Sporanaerobium hydrogeniformans TaxID=3072179 RepID=A0AC61DA34_9FIRM|nr:S-layer homology domain-containing protein [Sporanaerobium hydrogeniformans]PHV69516.1 hypothetical protein CS063_15445 [Sporanaerobium hydrogeniformans]
MKKATIQKMSILILCLGMMVPQVSFANTVNKTTSSTYTVKGKVLKKIKATPNELILPRGSSEEDFKKQVKVEAYYKGVTEPIEVKNYETNYVDIKDKLGSYNVTIKYTENGCSASTKVCVTIEEAPTSIINYPYVGGYEDGTFRPDQAVTREEFASMLARIISDANVPKMPNIYTDLNPARYSTDNINYVTKLGIFAPDAEGKFNPFDTVTEKEFLEVVSKLAPYIKGESQELSKLSQSDKLVSRAQAVVIINQLFNRLCKQTNIVNPYSDLPENYWAYQAILCASVKNEQPAIEPRR